RLDEFAKPSNRLAHMPVGVDDFVVCHGLLLSCGGFYLATSHRRVAALSFGKSRVTFSSAQCSNILPRVGLRQANLSPEIERANSNPSSRSLPVASLPFSPAIGLCKGRLLGRRERQIAAGRFHVFGIPKTSQSTSAGCTNTL